MKDSRFIELLNLYVDQQLTAQGAAELEAEISKSTERRRTYQQYCRMQNACARLFETERNQAPASLALTQALADANRKIIAFPHRRPIWTRTIPASGFAAIAACVVFVAVSRQRQLKSEGTSPAVAQSVQVASSRPIAISAPAQTKAPTRPEFYSVFSGRRLSPSVNATEPEVAVETTADRANLDWMRRVDLQPVRPVFADHFAFDPSPTVSRDTIELNSRRTQQGNAVEKTIFMFQR